MVGEVGLLSVEQLLANSKAAADALRTGRSSGAKSAVEKLLEQRDSPIEDIVDISPVQRILQAQEAKKSEKSYFESDDFLELKVAQLKGQLATFSSIPGLDTDGSNINRIQAEIQAIIAIQADDQAKLTAEAKEKQDILDEKALLEAREPTSVDDLLNRAKNEANGIRPGVELSPAAQRLLDNIGSTVDTTA